MVITVNQAEKALAYTVQQREVRSRNNRKIRESVNSLAGKVAGAVINTSSSGVGGFGQSHYARYEVDYADLRTYLYVIDGIPMHNFTSDGSMEFGSRGTTESIADMNPR